MQDQYAGDVGDFGKFALLRSLGAGRRLGVCWYVPGGLYRPSNDGKHVRYVDRPDRFRHLDESLFDVFCRFVSNVEGGHAARSIKALEGLGLLPPGTIYHDSPCPASLPERQHWAAMMSSAMA